ncbi:hypothetical protein [Arthrobacter sp. FW306-06-A]|uniref:hypothetical protein n=1 Tax=Arthrobacter sp. FW306-06-A TaxID=2879621 RepID=UPI001F4837A6|nr:hypothetical protein [Arthrobacter sp. FW306-06-A]UKA73510.1 hypothetical protein LFT49_22205 [Arthrobacter sp. FW306-06-A]
MSTRRGFVGFPSEERIDREDGMATRPAGFTGFAGFAGFAGFTGFAGFAGFASKKSIDREASFSSKTTVAAYVLGHVLGGK